MRAFLFSINRYWLVYLCYQTTNIPMTEEQLLVRLNARAHITVVGTKEEIDDAAIKFGWQYTIKPLCEDEDIIVAAVDLNSHDIFAIIGTDWEVWPIRETVINYSRYGKIFTLKSTKLEDLFFPEYEGVHAGMNARLEAENVSHWCRMLGLGFGFSWEQLKDMLTFCEINELLDQAILIQGELDKIKA